MIALFLCLLRTAQISAAPKSDFNFSYIESQRQPFIMKEGKSLSAWVRESDRNPAPAHAEDNALIALMYLEHYEKTGDQASLKKSREALDFLMAVEKEGGIFASSWPESSSDGAGTEVRADLPSAYSFWALARGLRILAGHDPSYGRILSSHIEGAVAMLKSVKESRPAENLSSIQGLELQGALVGGRSDVTSLYVLGLLDYYEAGQNGDAKGLIHRFCNGIKSFSSSGYEEFPFGGFYQILDHFTCWTLPHNRQISALALAGRKFTDKSWTSAAEREANGLYAHFLASYGPMCGMAPAPVIYPQEPAGAETMTSNLMNLYRVTGKEQYAHMAGLTGLLVHRE